MKSARELSFAFLIRAWPLFAKLLAPLEKKKMQAFREKGKAHSPIFIIGPPRSGSTFTYQFLTENLLVEYFDNLNHALYRTPFLGNRISHLLFDDRPHGSFSSRGGNTIREGWHAPSECPPYWYRSIPRNKHRIEPDDLNEIERSRLRDPLLAIMGKRDRAFLVKNLLSIERMDLIKELFPNARFLFLKRDRLRTAISIVRQREILGIPEADWWSARPPEYPQLKELPLRQRVAAQIHYIEEEAHRSLKEVPEEQKKELAYEKIVNEPGNALQELRSDFLSDLSLRQKGISQPKSKGPSKEPSEEEFEKAKEGFLKLELPYE